MPTPPDPTPWTHRLGLWDGADPIREGDIGPTTPLLFYRETAPLPTASHFGAWQWFADERAAWDYVRHALLPHLVGVWFTDDPAATHLRPIARVLDEARAAGWPPDDLAVVRAVLADLDAAPDLDAVARAGVRFDARFGRTRTWDLSFTALRGPRAALEWLRAARPADFVASQADELGAIAPARVLSALEVGPADADRFAPDLALLLRAFFEQDEL